MRELRARTQEIGAEYWAVREKQSERVAVAQMCMVLAQAETEAAQAVAVFLASPAAESALAEALITVKGQPVNSGRTDWKPEAAIILASWRKSVKP